MRWLLEWCRSARRAAPKPNPRALDPAFQRAARIVTSLDRVPPPDHEDFVALRGRGFAALRRSREARRRRDVG